MTRMIDKLTAWLGSVPTITAVVILLLTWTAGGFVVGFSDQYQLPVNTVTTIVTSIMTFVILNNNNRSDRAMHAKLDAIIAALPDADDALERAEDKREAEIEELRS